MGCYAYTSDNIADVSRQAMQSGAEYVICIPSEIEEMKPMLEAHKAQSLNGRSVPRMLFSDTAYGADVLKIHGDAAEGIEGVAFGADPESGFDVSYRTFSMLRLLLENLSSTMPLCSSAMPHGTSSSDRSCRYRNH